MAQFAHKRAAYGMFLALPLMAALSFPANAQTWKINLRDADLTAFVNEVADITGKNFAVDPRVKGTVTVISNKALTRDQVYDLFLGVLNVNGVVAIPSGNTIKLMPDTNAKTSGIPFDNKNRYRGEQLVTRVIWLDNTNPNDMIPAIRPMMPQFAHLAAIPGTNALIMFDRADNIAQIERLIRNLDGTNEDDVEAVTLRNSQADEIIGMVDNMSSTSANRDPRGSRVRLIADARSNRILIKGDSHSRQRIREIIRMLDVAPADRLGGMRVFYLKHASAKNLAAMLQGLVTGQAVSNASGSSGSSGSSSNNSMNNTNTSTNNNNNGGAPTINLSSTPSNDSSKLTSYSGGGVSIIADETQNALVVKADPSIMREIESAINQLDSRRAQVLIEAAIVEVSGTNTDQLGIQWAMGDLSSGVGLVNFSNVGAGLASIAAAASTGSASAIANVASSLSGAAVAVGDSRQRNGKTNFYGALIQALKANVHANLLSVPSVMTLDNEEAHIVVGQNVPFLTGSTTLNNGSASPYQTVERKDVGITLKVVPHIGEGGTVRLEVEQEVSTVVPSSNSVSKVDVTTNKRLIKTQILADNQQTIVLGGLIQDDTTSSTQAIPGLSRIPLLGRLFRSDSADKEKRNLLVFLHPTIVRDGVFANDLTNSRYGQMRSLQIQLEPNGNISRLPDQLDQIYTVNTQQPVAKVTKTTVVTPKKNVTTTVVTPAPTQNYAPVIITPTAVPATNLNDTSSDDTVTSSTTTTATPAVQPKRQPVVAARKIPAQTIRLVSGARHP